MGGSRGAEINLPKKVNEQKEYKWVSMKWVLPKWEP